MASIPISADHPTLQELVDLVMARALAANPEIQTPIKPQ